MDAPDSWKIVTMYIVRLSMPVNDVSVLATPTMEKGRQNRALQSVAHMRESFMVMAAVVGASSPGTLRDIKMDSNSPCNSSALQPSPLMRHRTCLASSSRLTDTRK